MEKEFLPGDTVLFAGEITPFLFMIKRGSVKLEKNGEVFFLHKDDFFGEESCFFGKPALFNVIAKEEAQLQLMERDEAERFFCDNGEKAFTLFIKNWARANDKEEPFDEMSPLHMRLVACILPFVVEKSGREPVNEAGIDIETLSSEIEMPKDKLEELLGFSKVFGYVAFSEGKIFTCGRDKLGSLFMKYNRERIFAGAKGEKGLGSVSFLNVLNKKTNI